MTIPDITIEPPRLGEPYLLTPGPLTTLRFYLENFANNIRMFP